MAPQLPASALAAISGYVDREEPAGPPAPAAAPPVPAPALDREEPAAPPPVPPPARDREEQTLREIEPLDASAVFALLHPDGPGYAVVDGVLGQETARRAARAVCREASMSTVSGCDPPNTRLAIRSASSSVVTASRRSSSVAL